MKTVITRAHFCLAKTGLSGGSAAGAAASRPYNPLRPTGFKKWFNFGTGSRRSWQGRAEEGLFSPNFYLFPLPQGNLEKFPFLRYLCTRLRRRLKKKYQSEILMVCHQDAEALHRIGAITDDEMAEYNRDCLVNPPNPAKAPETVQPHSVTALL
jgi:hypothetical protein